jgi:hypothetical protein
MDIYNFRIGDIILVHRQAPYNTFDSILAPIIRNVTGCYYNHVCIVGTCLGELYVFEAFGKGFYPTRPLEEYLTTVGKNREIAVKRLRKKEKYNYGLEDSVIEKRMSSFIDKGYDIKSLAWYQLWYHLTGRWSGKTGNSAKDLVYCSEVIAYVYSEIFMFPWLITPKDIFLEKRLELVLESNTTKRLEFHKKNEKI